MSEWAYLVGLRILGQVNNHFGILTVRLQVEKKIEERLKVIKGGLEEGEKEKGRT